MPNCAGFGIAADATSAVLSGNSEDPGTRTSRLPSYNTGGTLNWAVTSAAGGFHAVTIDTPNNAIYAVGEAASGNGDFLIHKHDLAGNSNWTRTFDRSSAADSLAGVTLFNGRQFAAGSTRGMTAGGSDGVVLEFSTVNGDLTSTTLWGGTLDDAFTGLTTSADTLHLAGTTASFGGGGTDLAYVAFAVTPVPEPVLLAFMLFMTCVSRGTRQLETQDRVC